MFLWKDAGLFSVLKDELIIQLKKLTQSIFAITLDNETALKDNMLLKLANVKAFRDQGWQYGTVRWYGTVRLEFC